MDRQRLIRVVFCWACLSCVSAWGTETARDRSAYGHGPAIRGSRMPAPAEPTWFGLPPVRFQSMHPYHAPNVIQRWGESTRQAWDRTRQVVTAPFTALSYRMSQIQFWPVRENSRDSNAEESRGWLRSEEPEPRRITSVSDFLALPRPE